mmetsp:Transcript_27227/g.45785  ORF Transcript_27227/g.45785 Transcript_27227/m.45785 type:complete len:88 (+) Transcript_27227:131-394(+)
MQEYEKGKGWLGVRFGDGGMIYKEHRQCVELKRSMSVNLGAKLGAAVRIFMTLDVAWMARLQLSLHGANVIEVCSSKPYPFPVAMAS